MGFSITAKASEAERHLSEVTCILYHTNKVFSGGDDGKIKLGSDLDFCFDRQPLTSCSGSQGHRSAVVNGPGGPGPRGARRFRFFAAPVWTPDLKLIKEIDAHPVNVYWLAASDSTLYSCSNDGTIKAWALDNYELKKTLVEHPQNEISRLYFTEGRLYSGDDKGNVVVWEDDQQAGKYEVAEEVWDILVHGSLLFTVRNMDVSIIEMKPGFKHYSYLHSVSGRSPMKKVGDYFCFLEREARNIKVCQLSKELKFEHIGTLQGHEMIVNTLASVDMPEPTIFSGGYDKNVKRWDVKTQKNTGTAELATVVNTLAAADINSVYVGSEVGYLAKVEFK